MSGLVERPVTGIFRLDERRSPSGCFGFEDGLDGFVIHAEGCPNAGCGWLSGSDCIGYTTWRGTWPDWADR